MEKFKDLFTVDIVNSDYIVLENLMILASLNMLKMYDTFQAFIG